MKKKIIIHLILSICLMCFIGNVVNAQCKYNLVDFKGNVIPFSIHSDFPLKITTGDTKTDQNNFDIAMAAWYKDNQLNNVAILPNLSTSGISSIYFDIPKAEFDLFSVDRKNTITANSDLYKVN